MKKFLLYASMLLLFGYSTLTFSLNEEMYPFETLMQQQEFQQLLKQLRCLVCQHQDLSESNAPLATDLRDQVYHMLQEGKDRDQVIAYLTDRYGEFVLLQPTKKISTYALWYGPFILLAIGLIVLVTYVISKHNKPRKPHD